MKQAISKVVMAVGALTHMLTGERVSVCLGQSLMVPVAGPFGHPGTSPVLPVTLPKILCRVCFGRSHHQAGVDLHF